MKYPERFLLIDDDPFNNTLCEIALKRAFGTPNIVDFTKPEAFLAYIESEYAVNPVSTFVFLDINMPTLSGWEVLEAFDKFPETIKSYFKIFILSSSVDPGDQQKAGENPLVSGYYEKPINKSQLLALVQ